MPYFTHEGHRLHYREQGSGRPLLILPGDTSSAAHHSGELAHFGDRYHSVSLDFRGTGRSDRIETWPADWWEICVEDTRRRWFATWAKGPPYSLAKAQEPPSR